MLSLVVQLCGVALFSVFLRSEILIPLSCYTSYAQYHQPSPISHLKITSPILCRLIQKSVPLNSAGLSPYRIAASGLNEKFQMATLSTSRVFRVVITIAQFFGDEKYCGTVALMLVQFKASFTLPPHRLLGSI